MRGSIFKIDCTNYQLEASSYTNTTFEKATCALSTVNISQSKISEQSSEDSLSNIIVNFENFWVKKDANFEKQSSHLGLNLAINSIVSSSTHKKHSINELSLKSVSGRENANNFDKNKNSSFFLPRVQKKPSFSKSVRPHPKLNLSQSIQSLQPVSKVDLSIQTIKESPPQDSTQPKFVDNIEDFSESRLQQPEDETKMLTNYLDVLKSLSLIGKICSELLTEQNIRWKSIAILSYLESFRRLSNIGINPSQKLNEPEWLLDGFIDRHSSQGLKIDEQFDDIVNEYLMRGDDFQKFVLLIKQSKKAIEDIMSMKMLESYHFCMHRIIIGMGMLGSLNGMEIGELELIENSYQMSPAILRKNMLLYKQLIHFSQKVSA